MRTSNFEAQPTNAFSATINEMFSGSYQLPTTTERAVSDKEIVLSTSRKLGGATQHLIGGSEKHICLLSFEF